MAVLSTVLAPVPASFDNHLTTPEPSRVTVVPRYGLLVVLVLLCLIPRVWMATKLASLCPDAVLYVQMAQALEQGDIETGFGQIRLNTYPLLLIGLNRLGLDWDVAGKYWGVVVSSLLVLPLFGWVRRQFDDRVALVACLFYATHAEFITWSPEAIRDPTFWFLFMLSIYLLWRAITEVRFGLFVGAGLTIAMAVFTRFEGTFLLIPLVLWSFWRWRTLAQGRWRLIAGPLLGVFAFPAIVLLVNSMWLQRYDCWGVCRTLPLYVAKLWALKSVSPSTAVAVAGGVDLALDMTFMRMVCTFIPTVVKGLTPTYLLLMFGGIWGWRGVWKRSDQQPLFYVALVILASMWIHLSFARGSCPRYALPIVLMASPYAALGLLALSVRLLHWLDARSASSETLRLRWAALAPGLIVAGLGLGDALGNDCTVRAGEVRLGQWIRQEIGAAPKLLGVEGLTAVVNHYAQGTCQTFPVWTDDETILARLRETQPDVVVMLEWRWTSEADGQTLLERAEAHGYRRIEHQCLPEECREMLIVVREGKASRVGRRAAPEATTCRSDQPHPL